MTAFLLVIPLPKEHHALAEPLLRTAASFFEAHGTVKRTDLGTFRRAGRSDDEFLKLVSFATNIEAGDAGTTRARALEGVLRATLASAGVRATEARVFVTDAAASP